MAAPAFAEDGSSLPPLPPGGSSLPSLPPGLPSDGWAGSSLWVNSPGEVAFAHFGTDVPAPFPLLQSGGSWPLDDDILGGDILTGSDALPLEDLDWWESDQWSDILTGSDALPLEDLDWWESDQWSHGHDDLPMLAGRTDESLDHLNFDFFVGSQTTDESPGTNHVQVDAAGPPATGYSLLATLADGPNEAGVDGLEPPPEPSADEMEVAEMVRKATQCGEDDAGTVWSEEEHKLLLDRLNLYAKCDKVYRCLKIACELPNKTALDVALRCRWFQDKEKTAKQDELLQKDGSAGGKVKVNGNGTKGAKNNKKMYPLSQDALDSKSTKELIRDNYMFLKRIEENLKRGQLDNTTNYFYCVKTNMDAIEKRVSKFGISMTMPPIDEEGLQEIIRSHLEDSSAQK